MAIESNLWDPRERLTSRVAVLAHMEAALEDGDPTVIAAAHEDMARAQAQCAEPPADERLAAVPGALKS